jgi:stage V sporulation protein AC
MDIKKSINKEQYKKYVKEKAPKSKTVKECILAFIVGGFICIIGQAVSDFGETVFKLGPDDLASFTATVMIFLGAILTGFGVYDVIGKVAGAGSIVPITGFANSIVSPAMDFKSEGLVMGIGAKLFSIAGAVLVYGISSAVIASIIYFFVR